MASNYSAVRQYGNYIQPVDMEMFAKGLQMKQGTYDAVGDQIQGTIDSLANLDLVRDVDKQYLDNKVNSILSDINRFGSGDLSKSSVSHSLNRAIGSVVDDNVVNAYESTLNYRNYQSEVKAIKEKNDGRYSEINEMYGLRGLGDWLQNKDVGKTYSPGKYIPFTDVQGKLSKTMEDLVKNKGTQTVQIPTGDGRMVTKKVKELTQAEIRRVSIASLDEADQKQLAITGWHNFGRLPKEELNKYLDTHAKGELETHDANISAMKIRISGEKDLKKKERLEQKLSALEANKDNYTKYVGQIKSSKNPETIGTYLEQESVIKSTSNKYAFKEVDVEYSNDVAYWNSVDYNYKVKNDLRNYELKKAKYDFDVAKSNGVLKGSSGGFDTNNDGIKDGIQTNSQEDLGNLPSSEKAHTERVEGLRTQNENSLEQVINSLDGETSQNFENVMVGLRKSHKNLSEFERKQMAYDQLLSKGDNVSLELRHGYEKSLSMLKSEVQLSENAYREASKVSDDKLKDYFEVMKSKPNIGFMDGFRNKDFVNLTSEERSTIKGKMWSDLAVSELNSDKSLFTDIYTDSGNIAGGEYGGNIEEGSFYMGNKMFEEKKPKMSYYVSGISQSYGEDVTFDDLFITETRDNSQRTLGSVLKTVGKVGLVPGLGVGETITGGNPFNTVTNSSKKLTLNPKYANTKTYQTIANTMANNDYDTSYGLRDDSVNDVSRINSDLKYGNAQKYYREQLEQSQADLGRGRVTTFSDGETQHELLNRLGTGKGVDFSKTKNISIKSISSDNSMYQLEQPQGLTSKGEQKPPKVTTVSRLELEENGFGNYMELDPQPSQHRANNMRPLVNPSVSFMDDSNQEDFEYVARQMGANGLQSQAHFVTPVGTEKYLTNKYASVLQDETVGQQFQTIIDGYVDNPSALGYQVAPNKNRTNVMGKLTDSKGNAISSTNFGEEFDGHFDTYTLAPQVFVGTNIDKILAEAQAQYSSNGRILKSGEFYKLYNIYAR